MRWLYGRVLDAPFDLIHLVSVVVSRRRAAAVDREMQTINKIASGRWIEEDA